MRGGANYAIRTGPRHRTPRAPRVLHRGLGRCESETRLRSAPENKQNAPVACPSVTTTFGRPVGRLRRARLWLCFTKQNNDNYNNIAAWTPGAVETACRTRASSSVCLSRATRTAWTRPIFDRTRARRSHFPISRRPTCYRLHGISLSQRARTVSPERPRTANLDGSHVPGYIRSLGTCRWSTSDSDCSYCYLFLCTLYFETH